MTRGLTRLSLAAWAAAVSVFFTLPAIEAARPVRHGFIPILPAPLQLADWRVTGNKTGRNKPGTLVLAVDQLGKDELKRPRMPSQVEIA